MFKLKDTIKQTIRDTLLTTWAGALRSGASPEHILSMCAAYTIELLQVPLDVKKDWYEPSSRKETTMLRPVELSHEECILVLTTIQSILYSEVRDGRLVWSPSKEWNADMLDAIANSLDTFGLVPSKEEDGAMVVEKEEK